MQFWLQIFFFPLKLVESSGIEGCGYRGLPTTLNPLASRSNIALPTPKRTKPIFLILTRKVESWKNTTANTRTFQSSLHVDNCKQISLSELSTQHVPEQCTFWYSMVDTATYEQRNTMKQCGWDCHKDASKRERTWQGQRDFTDLMRARRRPKNIDHWIPVA